jgi:hypothetical protein
MEGINMAQNICSVCHKQFNTEQELQEHQRNAHPTGKKEVDRPSGEQRREDKIAS